MRRSTSNDVLSVKIGPMSASVDLRKNWEKKCSKHSKNLGLYFRLYGGKTPWADWAQIFLEEGIRDVITCFKSGDDRFRGLKSAEAQILPFPIDFDGRPYNTLTLPCERVITGCAVAQALC